VLITSPRLHCHRYHRVLTPNAPLRAQVTALAPPPMLVTPDASHAPARSPARTLWAVLLARVYEILPLRGGLCGAQMRIIAFVTDAPAVTTLLGHLGEPPKANATPPVGKPPCSLKRHLGQPNPPGRQAV
jgi:hypothetical protein